MRRISPSKLRFAAAIVLAAIIGVSAMLAIGASGASSDGASRTDATERAMQEFAQDPPDCVIAHFPPVACE